MNKAPAIKGEDDFAQKLALRRAFRAYGWGTRTNVLLADVSDAHGDLKPQSYTDIDVLGISVGPDLRQLYTVGYCTTQRATSERVFWLRGVCDEFGPAEAIFVASAFPDAARGLCVRNRIVALTEAELMTYATAAERFVTPARRTFEARLEAGVAEYSRGIRTLGRSFDVVTAYRDWVYVQLGHARNLQVAISTIRLTRDEWRPTDPRHLALLLDITLLYTIALVDAAHYVHSAGRSDVANAVATYVGGGTAAMRDKRTLTKLVGQLLEQLATQGVQLPASVREAIRPVPAYTSEIATIVTAFMEAPAVVASLPWHIETLQRAAVLGLRDLVGELVDAGANPEQTERSFRMVREVFGFLVSQSGLSRDALTAFDALLAPNDQPKRANQTRLALGATAR